MDCSNYFRRSEPFSSMAVCSHIADARSSSNEDISKSPKCATVSYLAVISRAILASPSKRLPLAEIYRFIEENYPNFTEGRRHWKNTIRHNLSLHEGFVKGELSTNQRCSYWQIHPKYLARFSRGNFSKRIPPEEESYFYRIAALPDSYCAPTSHERIWDLPRNFQPAPHPFPLPNRSEREWPHVFRNTAFLQEPVPVRMCSPLFGRRLHQNHLYLNGFWSKDGAY